MMFDVGNEAAGVYHTGFVMWSGRYFGFYEEKQFMESGLTDKIV